jgi:RNA polymerase sigma-70 factor (ECF subfamily)
MTGAVSWPAIAALHDALVALTPTIGALVARAAAHGQAFGAAGGIALLDALPSMAVADYQPHWAVRAHLLARLGDGPGARAAYDRALGLTEDPAVRAFLIARRAAV